MQDVVGRQRLDERDQLRLAFARDARRDVDEAVRVRGHKVERAFSADGPLATGVAATVPLAGSLVRRLGPVELGLDRRPPAPGHPCVAGVAAAQHPDPDREVVPADHPQALVERRTPCLLEPMPVLGAAAEQPRAGLGVGLIPEFGGGTHDAQADLVPLDLVGDERWDQVVDIRGARDQHCERAVGADVPTPAARRGLRLGPVRDVEAVGDQRLGGLPHDHVRGTSDRLWQAADRVQEGAEVEVLAVGQRVQARAHRAVRGLEHAQAGLAARAQQRRVGAQVELDLVREPFAGVGQARYG